jgi:hypothetical protein
MVDRAQETDNNEIADLYARNHPEQNGRLTDAVQVMGTATFVTRDRASHVTGFAMVIALDCGVRPYGIVHQLEVSLHSSKQVQFDIRDALVDASVTWLAEYGITLVYARAADKGADTLAMLRYGGSQEWSLDPATGEAKDAGRATVTESANPVGAPPRSVQAARYVSN